MSYKHVNVNRLGKNAGDCTVRAIALATGKTWGETYWDLCLQGYILAEMPSINSTWGAYLMEKGWKHHRLQDTCPFCYTVRDFAEEHSIGTYIVGTGSHVICIKNGDWLDTWDSGEKTVMFYFSQE